jgi:Enoyl-CoA hydratase/isomerase
MANFNSEPVRVTSKRVQKISAVISMMLSTLLRVPSTRGVICRALASSAVKAPPLKDLKFHMDQDTEGLGIITFDRAGSRDALSVEMAHSVVTLVEHLNQLQPGELRCVIITGSSEKSFSAGRDLKVMSTFLSAFAFAIQQLTA